MKYEYLIFNLIVISGPLFFGSLRRFYFLDKLRKASLAIFVPIIPFLVWDNLVTGRHWFFNENYTLDFRIFSLPIEEILFFVTVPIACIFTWEMINRFSQGLNFYLSRKIYFIPFLLIPAGIWLFLISKEYTALVLFSISISIFYDKLLKTELFIHKNFLFYLFLISIFTTIFNGYLTWRPVVTYDEFYQLGIRISTIPIEDYFFGFSMLFIATSTYLKLTESKNE